MTTFFPYIIKSPEYYDVPEDKEASVVGNLAFYAELAILPSHFLIGGVLDIFGRKIPTVLGMLISGVCICLIPFGRSVYPDLCILRLTIAIGVLVAMNSPLLPDYIKS